MSAVMVLPLDLIDCRLILLMQVVLLMVLLTAYLMVSIPMHLACMIIGMRLVSINMLSHAYPLTTTYWAPDHRNAEKIERVGEFENSNCLRKLTLPVCGRV